MIETYFLFYMAVAIISLYFIFYSLKEKEKLETLEAGAPIEDVESEFNRLTEVKQKKPEQLLTQGLQETVFFNWWLLQNDPFVEGAQKGVIGSLRRLYLHLSQKGPWLAIAFIVIFFPSLLFSRQLGVGLDLFSLILTLIFIYYLDQTKLLVALSLVSYLKEHEDRMTLADWALVSRLKSYVNYRIVQLGIIAGIYGTMVFLHPLILEYLILLFTGPIALGFFGLLAYVEANYGPEGYLAAFFIMVFTTPLYFILVEKVLVRGYFWFIKRFMIYAPFMKLAPAKATDGWSG